VFETSQANLSTPKYLHPRLIFNPYQINSKYCFSVFDCYLYIRNITYIFFIRNYKNSRTCNSSSTRWTMSHLLNHYKSAHRFLVSQIPTTPPQPLPTLLIPSMINIENMPSSGFFLIIRKSLGIRSTLRFPILIVSIGSLFLSLKKTMKK